MTISESKRFCVVVFLSLDSIIVNMENGCTHKERFTENVIYFNSIL